MRRGFNLAGPTRAIKLAITGSTCDKCWLEVAFKVRSSYPIFEYKAKALLAQSPYFPAVQARLFWRMAVKAGCSCALPSCPSVRQTIRAFGCLLVHTTGKVLPVMGICPVANT